jgi:hypothetical protein
MSQVWSDDGAKAALDLYITSPGSGLDGSVMCLFKQNLTVDKTLTLAALLAAEASFPGYSRKPLAAANWPPSVVSNHVASSTYGQTLAWTCAGGGTAESEYGYWVMNAGATKWLLADKFPTGPFPMVNSGDQISGQLTVTSQSHN